MHGSPISGGERTQVFLNEVQQIIDILRLTLNQVLHHLHRKQIDGECKEQGEHFEYSYRVWSGTAYYHGQNSLQLA